MFVQTPPCRYPPGQTPLWVDTPGTPFDLHWLGTLLPSFVRWNYSHRSVWDGLRTNYRKGNRFSFFVILIFRHLVLYGPWRSGLCSGSCGFTVLNVALPNKHVYFLTSPGQKIYHHPVCLTLSPESNFLFTAQIAIIYSSLKSLFHTN